MSDSTQNAGNLHQPRTGIGRTGLVLAFMAPVALVLMLAAKPGWGSPITALGGLALFLAPPVALIVSIIGWVRNSSRPAAIAGTVISALELLGFFGLTFLNLCR